VRIDRYGSAATTEAVTQSKASTADAASTTKLSSPNASTEDTATLSSGSDSVQSLTNTALQPDPSRATKVEGLRQAVTNGQYKLDAGQIADALSSSTV
jgi:flagellar biosynthesis anti-sigma factor FlgM